MAAQLIFGDSSWRGDEIHDRALRVAGGLAHMDIGEGDVIAIMLHNDPAYIEIMQGARLAGCYCCQVNWHFKADEVGYILRDSDTRVFFVEEGLLASVAQAIPSTVKVFAVRLHHQADAAAGPHDYHEWLAAQEPYTGPERSPRGNMAYTSGTTGRPKGVRRLPVPDDELAAQKKKMLALVSQTLGIAPGVRTYLSAPLYHSAAFLFAQQSMLHAECLVLGARFDAEQTLAAIERHRVQVAYLVPVMYVRLLRLPPEVRARYDLSSLRFVASTGAPCPPEIKRAMIDWLGPIIYETYASSETGMLTVADSETALRKPGCAGKPAYEAIVRIYDAEGKPCAPGEIGIVYGRQRTYTDFTYNNNDAARQTIGRDGLVTVGDMGYLDEEGDLYLCDRATDMVISGGVNIYPSEIEHVLVAMPGIADCVVFGIPDDEYGESLAAQVLPEADAVLDPAMIADALRQRIAGYKVPRRIEIVDALPRDDNGKIARRKIREPYWQNRRNRI